MTQTGGDCLAASLKCQGGDFALEEVTVAQSLIIRFADLNTLSVFIAGDIWSLR